MKRRWPIYAQAFGRDKSHVKRRGNKRRADSPKRIWNSLEAARIAVGILTSLCVVGLGFVITRTNTEDERKYQAQLRLETRNAERQARLDAQAKEERLARATEAKSERNRLATSLEAARAREETFAREKALRAEAFVREVALGREANLRADRIRAEERANVIAESLYNRRHEAWTSFNAEARRLVDTAGLIFEGSGSDSTPSNAHLSDLMAATRELGTLTATYGALFDEGFVRQISQLRLAAHDFRDGPTRENLNKIRGRYSELMRFARSNLIPPWIADRIRTRESDDVVQ